MSHASGRALAWTVLYNLCALLLVDIFSQCILLGGGLLTRVRANCDVHICLPHVRHILIVLLYKSAHAYSSPALYGECQGVIA